MNQTADVVVVGAGIAGSALATVLARRGLDVVVLERQTVYRDKVRGEVFLPWGVAEVQQLGLADTLVSAGGTYADRFARHDEWLAPEQAEAQMIPLDRLVPGVPGSLNVGHPEACAALSQAAEAAGATVVRGVGEVQVTRGPATVVTCDHNGASHQVRCRLAVGADGRHSSVRRQVGITLTEIEPATMGGGMLVDGLDEWPPGRNVLTTEGDVHFLAFPRRSGRVRVYLLWSVSQKARFTGPDRRQEFLDACRLRSVPATQAIGGARPAGPCSSYPMTDSWCNRIVDDGVVLIGDAAGWNDPIIGQGVSIAARDARTVADVLLAEATWSPSAFAGYVEERTERMRRLRISAQAATGVRCAFGPEGVASRRRLAEAAGAEPLVLAPFLAALIGPENVAAEAFADDNVDRILSF